MTSERVILIRKILGPVRAFMRRLLPCAFLLRTFRLASIGDRVRVSAFHVCVDVVGKPDIVHNLLDCTAFPFRSNSLRSIYSAHCLEHLSDPAARTFFDESFRALRSGGELLLDLPDPHKAFAMMRTFLENPEDGLLQRYLRDMKITQQKLDQRLRNHSDSTALRGWADHPLNVVSFAIFANYLNPAFDSEHLPVIHDPKILEQAVRNMSLDEFAEFILLSLPGTLRFSGGHCNVWTRDKICTFAHSAGFEIFSRVHKESLSLPSFLVPDSAFGRRDIWSHKFCLRKP